MPRCGSSPSATAVPTASSGPTASGSGRRCASRTAISTPPNYADLYARDKWFYPGHRSLARDVQARSHGAGSLYWLGMRDSTGTYLDGGKNYKLTVPQPVPGKLFWSVTVYDTETRSQVQTDQGKAALRSLFELKDVSSDASPPSYTSAPRRRQAREPVDQDHPRQRLVRLLPHLRPRTTRLRRQAGSPATSKRSNDAIIAPTRKEAYPLFSFGFQPKNRMSSPQNRLTHCQQTTSTWRISSAQSAILNI